MELDPKILKELLETFKIELKEQSEVMTNSLLQLEKGLSKDRQLEEITKIFRSAHNIKGAAHGLGITSVGKIAHAMETLFSKLKTREIDFTSPIIDLGLSAIDKLNEALTAFVKKEPCDFDVDAFISQLETCNSVVPAVANDLPLKPEEKPTNEKNLIKEAVNRIKKNTGDEEENDSIRISIQNIDKINSIMEEIQSSKIAMNNHYSELGKITAKFKEFDNLWLQHIKVNPLLTELNDYYSEVAQAIRKLQKTMQNNVAKLDMTANSLQDEIRRLRLIPASFLLYTLPRYVRDVSHQLNKAVELKINGSETKLDKYVLERLKDPIMHLIRNAIDHGIETKAIRKEHGKPETGRITIDINEDGNEVIITIRDDGSGIDFSNIKRKIEKKKLLTHAEVEALTNDELLGYLFAPGFSTKEAVTNISGRGVGLDIVQSNIHELKGSVSVTTLLHQHTTFTLRVPLTLSSERGILITLSDASYIFPTNAIEKILINIKQNELIHVGGRLAIMLDNRAVPICSLRMLLQEEEKQILEGQTLAMIVVSDNLHQVAFIIDDILGEREFVIKRLRAPLNRMKYIAGGTLMENNEVILVLNPINLLSMALNLSNQYQILNEEIKEEVLVKPNVLVVDDSITTRTLEKNILESNNYNVTVAVNGKEAWDIIQKNKFSLIITDVSMPIMDGLQLTEHIKKSSNFQHLPVIIVTSLGSEAEKARGIEAGADAYVVKNEFESDKLLQIIKQLV